MLVDHHCHLDFPQLSDDLEGVLARAQENGVETMVSISTLVSKVATYRELAEQYRNIYFTVGTHPHNADKERDLTVRELVQLSHHAKCVGIGEAGLDYHYETAPIADQEAGLRRHIQAARETGLPLEIHSREADDHMLRVLKEEHGKGAFPAVLHCFTGSRDFALAAIDMGLLVSFSGVVTFKSAQALRDLACELPLERILVETDAPYLAPVPYRGKTNEPAFVRHTAQAIADARGVSLDALGKATSDNFYRTYTKAVRPQREAGALDGAAGTGAPDSIVSGSSAS